MYCNSNSIKCELINGYAYDTTLEWLRVTNEIEKFIIDDDEIYTGRRSYNNIYDFTDNVLELTQERNYDTAIIRGFSADDFDKLDYSWTDENRYAIIIENNNLVSTKDKLGFRAILYK